MQDCIHGEAVAVAARLMPEERTGFVYSQVEDTDLSDLEYGIKLEDETTMSETSDGSSYLPMHNIYSHPVRFCQILLWSKYVRRCNNEFLFEICSPPRLQAMSS